MWSFSAIGTRWEIETAAPLAEETRADVMRCVERFDREWSRFRADSLVTRLARDGGRAPAPRDTSVMLGALSEMAESTRDAVNPLVGVSLESLGYDAAYSLRGGSPAPAPADWRSVLSWDAETIALQRPATIDVGALGKGRLVDIVSDIVGAATDGPLVVDASGDLAVRGGPVRIGLEHPLDPSRAIGVWEITDGALAASAINRRRWGAGFHHVLDARTGAPVSTVAATWAAGADALHADAAATALFFDGGPELAHAWKIPWVRMLTDGRVETSVGCPADLFTRKEPVPA